MSDTLDEVIEQLRFRIDMEGVDSAVRESSWNELQELDPHLFYLIGLARHAIDEIEIALEDKDIYGEWVHS